MQERIWGYLGTGSQVHSAESCHHVGHLSLHFIAFAHEQWNFTDIRCKVARDKLKFGKSPDSGLSGDLSWADNIDSK